MIDDMHQRVLCISYDCLGVLSTTTSNLIIAYFEQLDVMIPVHAVTYVITAGDFDNIYLNSSSLPTKKSALHGMGQKAT